MAKEPNRTILRHVQDYFRGAFSNSPRDTFKPGYEIRDLYPLPASWEAVADGINNEPWMKNRKNISHARIRHKDVKTIKDVASLIS